MSLTVADLRRALADFPDDMPVVLSKDEEGNGYSPLASAQPAMYHAETTWSGDWYPTEEQRAQDDEGDWDQAPGGSVSALFLWPVN